MNSMSPDELSEDEKAEADAALNQAVGEECDKLSKHFLHFLPSRYFLHFLPSVPPSFLPSFTSIFTSFLHFLSSFPSFLYFLSFLPLLYFLPSLP